MKKLILLLITLTTFTNVSYASFPVMETEPKEYTEESINIIKSPNSDYTWIYSLASFLLGILGWLFAIGSVGGAMGVSRFSS